MATAWILIGTALAAQAGDGLFEASADAGPSLGHRGVHFFVSGAGEARRLHAALPAQAFLLHAVAHLGRSDRGPETEKLARALGLTVKDGAVGSTEGHALADLNYWISWGDEDLAEVAFRMEHRASATPAVRFARAWALLRRAVREKRGFDKAVSALEGVEPFDAAFRTHVEALVRSVFPAVRGREVSRYAWIPSAFVPYVGGGAGFMHYQLKQYGDFVDFADLSVFTDYFSSDGYAPSAHVFGGTDVQLYRILFLTFEGRYVWANAKLGKDFIDFDPIDLAGFRLSTGVNVRF